MKVHVVIKYTVDAYEGDCTEALKHLLGRK